ncbi:UNVERIFIED_CONTAM: hypothetical protein Slati_2958900 [Sesamum latifolium]|uniref:Endonuclease/exonuclease/phosphatase domain-containing protein n=1 Tax=Sesamum latifolium TaxID=2727402 RepID=A0AAW2VJD6_9LAMI
MRRSSLLRRTKDGRPRLMVVSLKKTRRGCLVRAQSSISQRINYPRCYSRSTFLPRWTWFTDYTGPGNRIWIAWDDTMLGVDVLDVGQQYIHCRINIRCAHLSVLATIVYGPNDSIVRRELWQHLGMVSRSISDEPWVVGCDFNTVLDMSKVCGASADIHVSMSEFRDCILDTGLIHLSMQGELFTWHNCSEGDRSLWKRLDRLLVNDSWLNQWLNSYYQSLNARTSDHSPLLIRGDDNTNYASIF